MITLNVIKSKEQESVNIYNAIKNGVDLSDSLNDLLNKVNTFREEYREILNSIPFVTDEFSDDVSNILIGLVDELDNKSTLIIKGRNLKD